MSTLINLIFLGCGFILGFILGCKLMGTSIPADPEDLPPPPPSPEPRPSVFRKDKGKDLPLYLPGQGRLTEEQSKLRVACGMDPAKTEILTPEEITRENRSIDRQLREARPLWKLRIRKPGQRSRFYPYTDESLALAAYHAAPQKNYPDGTEVELIEPIIPASPK